MNKKMEELWKTEKHYEDKEKCQYCNDYTLVGTDPESILLMCRRCGKFFSYDEKEKKIYELHEQKKEN